MLDVIEGREDPGDALALDALCAAQSPLVGAIAQLARGMRFMATRPIEAAAEFDEVSAFATEHDHPLLVSGAGTVSAHLALQALPKSLAAELIGRGLQRSRERGMLSVLAADVAAAAELLRRAGKPDEAARALGARLASGYDTGLSVLVVASLQQTLRDELGDDLDGYLAEGAASGLSPAAARVCDVLATIADG